MKSAYFYLPFLLLCSHTSVFAQSLGFYPLVTQPNWARSSSSELFLGPDQSTSTNLYAGDGVQVIYPGMEGAFVVETVSLEHADLQSDFPLTRTQQDYSLTPEGLVHLGFRVYSYNANTVADATVSWFLDVNFEEVVLGQKTGDSPVVIPKTANVGQVYSYNYISTNVSEITGDALDLILGQFNDYEASRTTVVTDTEVRYAYVGFQDIDDLFPGSSPMQINDGANALIRVTEISGESSTTTELIGGANPVSDTSRSDPFTTTTIEWLVYGLGVVRTQLVFGAYLEAIMDAPVFDDGDGIISTRSLDDITGGIYTSIGLLSGVSGETDIRDARDVVVNGVIPVLGDYETSAVADAWWSNVGQRVSDDWYLDSDSGLLTYVPPSIQYGNSGEGWLYVDGLGFVYSQEEESGGFWWYNNDWGWVFGSADNLPYLYLETQDKWRYFISNDGVGWFYDFGTAQWTQANP